MRSTEKLISFNNPHTLESKFRGIPCSRLRHSHRAGARRLLKRSRSSIDPTQPRVVGYPIYSEHVGRQARVDLVLISKADYVVEAAHHYLQQSGIYRLFVPEEAHSVLHPLEITNCHAARIRQNVRNNEDMLSRDDLVGVLAAGVLSIATPLITGAASAWLETEDRKSPQPLAPRRACREQTLIELSRPRQRLPRMRLLSPISTPGGMMRSDLRGAGFVRGDHHPGVVVAKATSSFGSGWTPCLRRLPGIVGTRLLRIGSANSFSSVEITRR